MESIKTGALSKEDIEALSSLLFVRQKGGEYDGVPVLMIGLMVTLYFKYPWSQAAREAVSDVAAEYVAEFKDKLKWVQTPGDNPRFHALSKGRVAIPPEYPRNVAEGAEWDLGIHGGESGDAVSEYQIEGFGPQFRESYKDNLGYLKFHLPLRWLVDYPGDFQQRVLCVAKRIQAFHGYAGVGFLLPVSLSAAMGGETILSPFAMRFPGIEVDSPVTSAGDCTHAIKGVNWLTVLSDHLVEEAGGLDYLRVRLDEPTFPFFKYDGGLIIQAGARPEIGDTQEDRWPRHYVTIAKVLKKIQVTSHYSLHWKIPGVKRMNREETPAWIFRFDGK